MLAVLLLLVFLLLQSKLDRRMRDLKYQFSGGTAFSKEENNKKVLGLKRFGKRKKMKMET